jgi:hypothetical protein
MPIWLRVCEKQVGKADDRFSRSILRVQKSRPDWRKLSGNVTPPWSSCAKRKPVPIGNLVRLADDRESGDVVARCGTFASPLETISADS